MRILISCSLSVLRWKSTVGHAVGLSAVAGAEMRLVLELRPLLALTLSLTCLLLLSNVATPFPQDLEPISIVGSECEY